ncbi:hypothetical protein IFT90_02630 [Frigoribacterium sp. CFBP 8766]|uniref:hypothetical protein n=1 Tax=Frigoribacterium sp. CFBP 8766 TaxID=2775273 RepID=UPI001784F0BB|nr:hypothetical protein [Frigoribacterium sp. CFBP 8766]MBD8583451.1 hypothetical protein [Frigoribacterium sp. CFBP 8766]
MSNGMNTASLVNYRRVTSYPFCDLSGEVLFEKIRFELLPGRAGRAKEFRYFDPESQRYRKPADADRWLYRLPEVTAAIAACATIHWTEGEKDADALVAAGVEATSHHQGAGRVTPEQAAWLRNATSIVLWVDKDVEYPEVGAYDAARRHDLLLAAGVPGARIAFVCARGAGRKDAYDHLQRHSPDEAQPVAKQAVARLAALYSPASSSRLGYPRAR